MRIPFRSAIQTGVEHYRVLWLAVINTAIFDIEFGPFESVEYNQAVAFFTSDGAWAESREVIADAIDLHPDDLSRAGRRAISRRRRALGLPDNVPDVPPKKPTRAERKPRRPAFHPALLLPPPEIIRRPQLPVATDPPPPAKPKKPTRKRWEFNPDNPLLKR